MKWGPILQKSDRQLQMELEEEFVPKMTTGWSKFEKARGGRQFSVQVRTS